MNIATRDFNNYFKETGAPRKEFDHLFDDLVSHRKKLISLLREGSESRVIRLGSHFHDQYCKGEITSKQYNRAMEISDNLSNHFYWLKE
jgi:hypothetical protein